MRTSLLLAILLTTACSEEADSASASQTPTTASNPQTAAAMPSGSPAGDCVPDYSCDPEPPDTGDRYADCVARVNQFRACACLPPLARNTQAEGCLDQQAEYDSTRGAHAGFRDGICEPSGNAQNECPGWGSVEQVISGCIRMMYYEGPPPTDRCEGQCYQEHGHFINMTSQNAASVACGFYDANGEIWAVQNFFQ